MSLQLAFDLPPVSAFRREDFFPSVANAEALASIEAWQNWPLGKMILVGPEGAGKTHLAHLWAEMAGAVIVDAAALPERDLPSLAAYAAVCVENADRIGGDRAAETALFHLHYLLAGAQPGQGGRILVTAASPPRDWGLDLADLKSRMQGTALTALQAPDDALLSVVLVKLFNDRQIAVPANLIPYLAQRIDRSFAAAREVVGFLDAIALARGRPVTRALAAEILDRTGAQ